MYQYTEALAISVSFFFIIGGLFRSIPYWRTIYMNESMLDTKHTLIDRFWRIAPPYYAALIVSFLLALILGISGPDAIMRLVSGLAFLSWVHPSTLFPVDINGPLWYVSYDIMGLLIVMGIMIFLVKIPKKYISLGLFGSGALLLGLHFVFIHIPFPVSDGVANAWFPTYNPFLFGLHFLIGIVIGWGYIVGETNKRANSFVYDIIASVAFISILVFLWNIREAADFDYSWPR